MKNEKPKTKDVVIIGGGPSGIIAAIVAARNGADVTILEKGSQLGRKILVTGNGRCNMSNENISWQNYHGKYPKFSASVFGRFSNYDTLEFFRELGLETKVEDRGRIFPVSDQATSVLDVLLYELESLEINVLYKSKVTSINKSDYGFSIKLFNGKVIKADKVIISTGGKTFPKLGNTGDGYKLAETLGHKIETIFPVSVGLEVEHGYKTLCNKLQGVKVEAEARAVIGDMVLAEDVGTVLFTHFGLSAWAIMRLSFAVSRALNVDGNEMVDILIDFFPQYSVDDLDSLLEQRFKENPKKTLGFSFVGLMQKKLAPVLLEFVEFDTTRKVGEISKVDRRKIVETLKSFRLEVEGTRSWDEAQFTYGGVAVEEIDSKTMESKVILGLYFAGEVVDIVGDSGGYNLQWAWSSGYVAGEAASSE